MFKDSPKVSDDDHPLEKILAFRNLGWQRIGLYCRQSYPEAGLLA